MSAFDDLPILPLDSGMDARQRLEEAQAIIAQRHRTAVKLLDAPRLTAPQVAPLWRVRPETVHIWHQRGFLPAQRIRGRWFWPREELLRAAGIADPGDWPVLLTAPEAAGLLDCRVVTLEKRAHRGTFAAVRTPGGAQRYPASLVLDRLARAVEHEQDQERASRAAAAAPEPAAGR